VRGFLDDEAQERRGREEGNEEPVALDDVYADRETQMALLCVIEIGKRKQERWIPKSQIHDDSEVYRAGHRGKLIITGWFAEKEGLG
jgi:hypothetical protein